MDKKEKYSMAYENGRCPYGFQWVDPHYNGSFYVHGYCRKIKKHRFIEPENWS
jgi:hypothetical protein